MVVKNLQIFLINFCEKETRKKCSIKSFTEKITKNGNKLGKIAKLIIASDNNLTGEIITKKEYMELKSVCNQFKEKYKDASNRLSKIKEQVIK